MMIHIRRGVGCLLLGLLTGLAFPGEIEAQTKPAAGLPTNDGGTPRDFRSAHFLLHTDLSTSEAQELLVRLETMLRLISTYWGRQPDQPIEMYVVKQLANWPANVLEPAGRLSIETGGGLTISRGRALVSATGQSQLVSMKSICYAGADRGTPQHEAVHAYCHQSFGTSGPVWYSEGMAEMGQYWRDRDPSVQIHPGVVDYLRTNSIKSLNAIINNQEQTGDSWENYAWRWALCHLLANNPNYATKFRPLGLDLLHQRPNSFELAYGAMAKEISLEYKHFIATIENGYRVDLCAFDWKKNFLTLAGSSTISASVQAGRGWQPSQVIVVPGQTYEFTATGTWQTDPKAGAINADGDSDRLGQLVGVILFTDPSGEYTLSQEIPLGSQGTFSPMHNGRLFVRCRDAWGKIADNKGTINLKLKLAK